MNVLEQEVNTIKEKIWRRDGVDTDKVGLFKHNTME